MSADAPITFVKSIVISGIKGIPDRPEDWQLSLFKKSRPLSLAIFAPNACGKSSITDAIEYLFSEDGTVQHLGHSGERGGKSALRHVRSKKSQVSICLKSESSELTICREFKARNADKLSEELLSLTTSAPAHRILHQHDLRNFVVEKAPGQKYDIFAKWLGYDRVRQSQDDLKKATTKFAQKIKEVESWVTERNADLKRITGGAVSVFDQSQIVRWVNEDVLKGVMPGKTCGTLKDLYDIGKELDDSYQGLLKKVGHEQLQEGIEGLEYQLGLREVNPGKRLLKKLFEFEGLSEELSSENKSFNDTFEAAQTAIFKPLWEQSKSLLAAQEITACPVCETPISSSSLGSAEAIRIALEEKLGSLSGFEASQRKFRATISKAVSSLDINDIADQIVAQLTEIKVFSDLENRFYIAFKEAATSLKTSLSAFNFNSKTDLPSFERFAEASKELREQLLLALSKIKTEKAKLEANPQLQQFKEASEKIKSVAESFERYQLLQVYLNEMQGLQHQLIHALSVLNLKATTYLNSALCALKADTVSMCHKILGERGQVSVADIFLEIDKDNAGNPKNEIQLNIKFFDNIEPRKPGGYLSESFQNALGLSIFLSSARLFNEKFPFIVLDDIVSSFDAENRARIAQLIAEEMSSFQVILTTHDRAFFQVLNDTCSGASWRFQRIRGWHLDKGPDLEADYTKEGDIVNALENKGQPEFAGTLIRQHMEEWLDKKCYVFGAQTIHKRGERNLKWMLGELWDPFICRIQALSPEIKSWLVESPEYNKLKGSKVFANLLNHSQADPLIWLSAGDAETLWNDFRAFKQLFNCHCGAQLVYSFEHKIIICPKCGTGTLPPSNPSAGITKVSAMQV